MEIKSSSLRWVSRTVNWDDPIICMCQSDTAIKLRACKRTGHIRTFQIYFDSLSQQGFLLLFITSTKVYPWILSAAWWASMMYQRNIGNQANMQRLSRLWFLKMKVESPIQFRWRNTRTAHRAKINDWIYQFYIQLHKRAEKMQACNPYFDRKEETCFPAA